MIEHKQHIEVVPTKADLTTVAQDLIRAAAAYAIGRRQFFRIALSGGSTPQSVYAALAQDPDIEWSPWQLFWSDERAVPPTAPDSNYHMVKQALLDPLAHPPRVVVRMAGESDPSAAAAAYESAVREMVPADPHAGTGSAPRFDLILLGMGADGHTASLFPGTPALSETDRLVVANSGPPPFTERITFTYPLINAARRILVMVSGADKADTLRRVISGPSVPELLPIQGVQPINGVITWLVDQAAFAGIEREMR